MEATKKCQFIKQLYVTLLPYTFFIVSFVQNNFKHSHITPSRILAYWIAHCKLHILNKTLSCVLACVIFHPSVNYVRLIKSFCTYHKQNEKMVSTILIAHIRYLHTICPCNNLRNFNYFFNDKTIQTLADSLCDCTTNRFEIDCVLKALVHE